MQDIRPMGAVGLPKGQKGKDKLESLYKNPLYSAEKKFDGSRYTLRIDNNGGLFLQSRKESVKGGMCDKTDRVPHIIEEAGRLPVGTILDGEIDILEGRNFHYVQGCMGSLPERAIQIQEENQKLYYKCFDILEYKGRDLRNIPLRERREILDRLLKSEIKFQYIILVEQIKDEKEKRELFDKEIEKGMEGIILKNLEAIYQEDKKPANTWYKVKLVDTFDGVVVGYNPGQGKYTGTVGSLKVAQYLNGVLIEVADCGGMTDKLRDIFKKRIDKGERFIIEFAAQEPEAHNRYRHPRFKRVREDKNERDCIYGQK